MTDIEIFNESSTDIPLKHEEYRAIMDSIQDGENVTFGFIEIVYVNEDEIVKVNQDHLGRDYITDIITFTYSSEDDEFNALDGTDIDGTIYMCAPRIIEQSKELNVSVKQEFKRIFIHGLLHLCGYDDNTDELKKVMTSKENAYLSE
ncbi:MAG: rRNA maturation RNase YbeY [Balneolales bacterium]|nr:rRNA maturation RNase YbeY [Balneolales bacterium]